MACHRHVAKSNANGTQTTNQQEGRRMTSDQNNVNKGCSVASDETHTTSENEGRGMASVEQDTKGFCIMSNENSCIQVDADCQPKSDQKGQKSTKKRHITALHATATAQVSIKSGDAMDLTFPMQPETGEVCADADFGDMSQIVDLAQGGQRVVFDYEGTQEGEVAQPASQAASQENATGTNASADQAQEELQAGHDQPTIAQEVTGIGADATAQGTAKDTTDQPATAQEATDTQTTDADFSDMEAVARAAQSGPRIDLTIVADAQEVEWTEGMRDEGLLAEDDLTPEMHLARAQAILTSNKEKSSTRSAMYILGRLVGGTYITETKAGVIFAEAKGRSLDKYEMKALEDGRKAPFVKLPAKFEWPTIVGFAEDSETKFDTRILPIKLRVCVDEIAEKIEIPSQVVLLSALTSLAAVAQRKYRLRVNDGYIIPCNLFSITILPPSNRKTSVTKIFQRKLDELSNRENERTKDTRLQNENSIKACKSAIARLQKKFADISAKASFNCHTELEKLKSQIKEITDAMPEEIHDTRLYIGSDTTPEALFFHMRYYGGYACVFDDEGSLFDILSGAYSNGKNVNIDIFNKSFDGSNYYRTRVGRSSDEDNGRTDAIENATLSINLNIQPEVFNGSAESMSKLKGKGLLARFIFTRPKSLMGSRKNQNIAPDKERLEPFLSILDDVFSVILSSNESIEQKNLISYSQEAIDVRKEYEDVIEKALGENGAFAEMRDVGGKLMGQVDRIASLLHIINFPKDAHENTISSDTVSRAIHIVKELTPYATRVYEDSNADESIPLAKKILQWIKRKNISYFRLKDAFTALKYSPEVKSRQDNLLSPLAALIERGYIVSAEPPKIPRSGRPTKQETFFVNPATKSL